MAKVFLSYVRKNGDLVNRLAEELKQHGITVWLDRKNLKPGYRWKDAIRQGISQGDFFIACFSKEYENCSKTYMNEELTLAIDELRQRPTDKAWFIPVRLSDCEIPDRPIGGGVTLRDLQWVDLYEDWQKGINQIVSVINPPKRKAFLDLVGYAKKLFNRYNAQIVDYFTEGDEITIVCKGYIIRSEDVDAIKEMGRRNGIRVEVKADIY